jgi:hypothetical protein
MKLKELVKAWDFLGPGFYKHADIFINKNTTRSRYTSQVLLMIATVGHPFITRFLPDMDYMALILEHTLIRKY